MTHPRISVEERRTRLAELVSVLGDCDPDRARAQMDRQQLRPAPALDLTDPEGFGGAHDPWSDVAVALVALRH